MAESPHIFDVAQADFAARVIEKSRTVPVLVDFWASWCAPCRALAPILTRLVEEYNGKLLLAKVDTETEQDLAREFAIRSIPAVKVFRDGQVVGEFVGVQPESTIRALVDRYISNEADATITQAAALAEAGEIDKAFGLLRDTVARNSQQDRPKIELARLLSQQPPEHLDAGQVEECQRMLDSLSVRAGMTPEVETLRGRLKLQRLVTDAPAREALEHALAVNTDDHTARLRLAARLVLAGEHAPAMEHLLKIVQRDRTFGDDAARKMLIDIFNQLGKQHPLVVKYRTLLSRALN